MWAKLGGTPFLRSRLRTERRSSRTLTAIPPGWAASFHHPPPLRRRFPPLAAYPPVDPEARPAVRARPVLARLGGLRFPRGSRGRRARRRSHRVGHRRGRAPSTC